MAYEKGFLLDTSNKNMMRALEKATRALGQANYEIVEGEEKEPTQVGPAKPKLVKKELSPGITYLTSE
jgi:hypothetical protein